MTKRSRPRTWLGHYVDHVRNQYPQAIVPEGYDPLADALSRDSGTADEYRQELDRIRETPRVAELLVWLLNETAVRRAELALGALRVRRALIDTDLERRAKRAFKPADSDYGELMALFEEHLALTYVVSNRQSDHAQRLLGLDGATTRVQAAERAELRATLREERHGFAELLARHLEAFLDGLTTSEDDDAYGSALLARARAHGAPAHAEVFADAFEEEVLRAISRGEAGILRALIQLPALIASADIAAGHAVGVARQAITLIASDEGEEGLGGDPWEAIEAAPIVLELPTADTDREHALTLARSLPPSQSREDILAVLAGETQADLARRTVRSRSAVSQSVRRGVREIQAQLGATRAT